MIPPMPTSKKAPPAKKAAPPAKKTAAKHASASNLPKVTVDPKLKKLYDTLTAEIAAQTDRDMHAWDARWEACARIVDHDPPLYLLGGFGTARDFFREVMHEEERTAYRWMNVAKFASPADEKAYGPTKLDAAVRYLTEKLGAFDGALPVSFDRLRIPTPGGKTATKPLARATVAEVNAATAALRSKSGKRKAHPAEGALRKALAKTEALKEVEPQVSPQGYASFRNVPLGSLAFFGRTVGEVTWTEKPTPKK